MPSRPRYVAIRTGLLVSCRVHPMWAIPVTQIAALAMHLIRFFKMVAHFVSGGFEYCFGVIARRWRVWRSVRTLGPVLGLFQACGHSARLSRPRSACRWRHRGRIPGAPATPLHAPGPRRLRHPRGVSGIRGNLHRPTPPAGCEHASGNECVRREPPPTRPNSGEGGSMLPIPSGRQRLPGFPFSPAPP